MGLARPDQISSKFALGQQGIARDVLALNRDGLQKRDRRLDLVRAFDFFFPLLLYRQGAHFFWV